MLEEHEDPETLFLLPISSFPKSWFEPEHVSSPNPSIWSSIHSFSLYISNQQYHMVWNRGKCFFFSPIKHHWILIQDPSFYQQHPFESSIPCGLTKGYLTKANSNQWYYFVTHVWIPSISPLSSSLSIDWIPNPFPTQYSILPWFFVFETKSLFHYTWSNTSKEQGFLRMVQYPILPIHFFKEKDHLIHLYSFLGIEYSNLDPKKIGFFFYSNSNSIYFEPNYFKQKKDHDIQKQIQSHLQFLSMDSLLLDFTIHIEGEIIATHKELDEYQWTGMWILPPPKEKEKHMNLYISNLDRVRKMRSKFTKNGDRQMIRACWNPSFSCWEPIF
jgi:hypothetical protein